MFAIFHIKILMNGDNYNKIAYTSDNQTNKYNPTHSIYMLILQNIHRRAMIEISNYE